jgi:hypothetical protein
MNFQPADRFSIEDFVLTMSVTGTRCNPYSSLVEFRFIAMTTGVQMEFGGSAPLRRTSHIGAGLSPKVHNLSILRGN